MREVEPAPPWWRDYAILAGVVAVVQAFQLTVLRHDVAVLGPLIDAFDFHREADRIASGIPPPHYPNFHPPYFPWLLSVIYRIGGSHPENGLYLQALLVLVIAWELYGIGLVWFDRRLALGAGIAAALYGPLLFHAGELTAAPLDAAAALGALLLATRFDATAGLAPHLALGLVGGLAIATRGTIAPFVLFLVLRPWWSSQSSTEKWPRIAAMAGSVLLGILPVALSNWLRSGAFTFTTMNGGINLWLGNNPDVRAATALRPGVQWDYLWGEPARNGALTLLEQTAYFRDKALHWIAQHPLDALSAFAIKLADTFNGLEIPRNLDPYGPLAHTPLTNLMLWQWPLLRFPFGLVLPLGVLGILLRWSTPAARTQTAFVVLNGIGIALFFPSGRYRLAIGLALLVPAAEGLRSLWKASIPQLAVVVAAVLAVNLMPQLTGPHLAEELPMQRAEAARSAGQWKEADRQLQAILKAHPDDANAWLLLGEVHDSGGDQLGAVEALKKAVALAPESANAWQHLASIHLDQGLKQEAIGELEAALKADPAQMFASAQLADASFQSGDYQRALTAGRQATQVNPDHPRGWLAYGAALRETGDPAASEPVLRKALTMQPKRAATHYQLAETLAVLGRKDEAIAEARAALQFAPQHHGAREILTQFGAE